MSRRRVAVIGAGIAGLAAVKSCQEEGLEPVCYEQHEDLGGIWYLTDDFRPGQGTRIYDSLVLNTSKAMYCYSDFPFPDSTPTYPTGKDIHGYLKDYAQTFGLLKHIQFNMKVVTVRRCSDYETTGCWDVETEVDGNRKWTRFEAVLVCPGFYHAARYPNVEGFDKFQGSVEHSQTFKDGSRYRGQNILVVGNSSSAGDIAVDVGKYAKQVYLCVGKGTILVPRLMKSGLPVDFMLTRALTLLPLPQSVLGKIIFRNANARLDHVGYKLLPDHLPPKGTIMINDELPLRLACGQVKITGNLALFGATHAEFDDGSNITDIDGVIFATGLKRKLSFLDPIVGADDSTLHLYKMIFPVQLPHNSLAMIGFFRTMGPVIPIAELQARLAARVLAGKHQLPDRTVMRRYVDRLNEQQMKTHGFCRYSFPNLPFRDELAEDLGVRPTLLELLKLGPSVCFQYYFGPAFNVHHRLVGPGAWDGAVQACAEAQYSGYTTQIRNIPPPRPSGNTFKLTVALLIGLSAAYLWSVLSDDSKV